MKKLMPLAASIVLILVASVFATAGTMALFTDTATSGPHTFTAGTLKISAGSQAWIGSIDKNNMKPGDTVRLEITVTSGGTLPLDYTISWAIAGGLSKDPNPCTVSKVYIDYVNTISGSLDANGGSDESDLVFIDITMPSEAGDWYQGKSGTITVTFNAVQQ